jgi:hypothetical protein
LILEKSKAFSENGNEWTGYSYKVPGGWQGRFEKLRIIGDKRGSNTSKHLSAQPELLETVSKWVPHLKLIHITRNPYDNITTCMRRRESKRHVDFSEADLQRKIDHHFHKVAAIERIRQSGKYDILDMTHESFVDDPRNKLIEICSFIGIDTTEAYLDACASIVFKKPHLSRTETDKWSPGLIEQVAALSKPYDFLEDYSWDA